MPDKKIIATFVLCFGAVISIWLIQKTQTGFSSKKSGEVVLSTVDSYKNVSIDTNEDWKKILVNLGPKNQLTTDISQNKNPEDTTLTSALAVDVFSKYLLIAGKSGGITTSDANSISNDVLSSFWYNNTGKVVYTSSNLKIMQASDTNTVRNYYESIHQKFTNRILKTKDSPVTILVDGLEKESDEYLSKINPFILTYRGIVSDLLNTSVPNDAVKVHLDLINAYSGVISDLESMRVAISDPIKGIVGISQYQQDQTNLQSALLNINNYFEKKLK